MTLATIGRPVAMLGAFAICTTTAGAQNGANPVVNPSGAASPVTINSCGPITQSSGPNVGGFTFGATSTGIKIEFVNQSNQTAQLVNFGVDSNGEHFVIRDVGTFSPGVSITHQYRNGAGQTFLLPQFIAPNVTCNVASVKFADGSIWRRGQGSSPPPGQAAGSGLLAANPSSLTIYSGAEADLFMVTGHRSGAFKENDTCAGIATVEIAATGESAATYSVRPLATGTCAAHVIDEDGHTVSVPITVR